MYEKYYKYLKLSLGKQLLQMSAEWWIYVLTNVFILYVDF